MVVAALPTEERRMIRCAGCGTILAAEVAGLSVVTRKGYEWVGNVVSMRCVCGTIWRPVSQLTDSVVDSR